MNQCKLYIHSIDETILSSGTHEYAFRCMLPPTLPSSIKHRVGYINYSISVKIERKIWAHREFKDTFSVIKETNLNDHPLAQVFESFQKKTN